MPSLNGSKTGSSGSLGSSTGRQYWRSLDSMSETVEFREWMHREFPSGASELLDGGERRDFLKIMGASFALAGLGLAGCRRWPKEEIVPAVRAAAERISGVPVDFATCVELQGHGIGVLAKTYEGRPIKLEGNPDHPASLGTTDAFTQAMILGLYDPDRSRSIAKGTGVTPGQIREATKDEKSDEEALATPALTPSSWPAFLSWADGHFGALEAERGTGVAVLSRATSSPSVALVRERMQKRFPQMTWHTYESVNNDEILAGSKLAFGSAWRTKLNLAEADCIVTLDADLFGADPQRVMNMRGFADRRRTLAATDSVNRLYAVEPDLTITGARADERANVRGGDVVAAAAYIAARILGDDVFKKFEDSDASSGSLTAEHRQVLDHIADDLVAAGNHGVITAGWRQPAVVHAICHRINESIGANGTTVMQMPTDETTSHRDSIESLAGAISDNRVSTLIVLDANPVYDAPDNLNFTTLMSSVETVVHVGEYVNETARHATWHVNQAHPLESWHDARSYTGVASVGQPMIQPLFDGKTIAEVIAVIAGERGFDAQTIAKAAFAKNAGTSDAKMWRLALERGVYGDESPTESPRVQVSPIASAVDNAVDAWARSRTGWEAVYAPSASVWDGRFANNGWLQETPDPRTKIVWDNAVVMSPKSARELGVSDGDMVAVKAGGRVVNAPALRCPGIADKTVILELGYGRSAAGNIGNDAGFDFGRLRTTDAMHIRPETTVTNVRIDEGTYTLATTQDHHTVDVSSTFAGAGVQERLPQLLREADLAEYEKHPDFASHRVHNPHRLSMWEERNLDDAMYAWGMTIDLSTCVGCNACVVACQAENNIPIVGKEQVVRGREMHWLRIDRYFSFAHSSSGYDADTLTGVGFQPMACVHCENAPCEQVCPVAATVHDHDGLNVMVYNRCIGTRYCSNNCPYKVRRFNYFDYHRRSPMRESTILQVKPDYYTQRSATPNELKQMQFNPEVTVRMRGVMEKCTYCIQRIAEARIEAKNEFAKIRSDVGRQLLRGEGLDDATSTTAFESERVPIEDGRIVTACEQACPTQSIVFGDLHDPNARVTQLQKNDRAYELLQELNTKPRTQYLARINNPHGKGDPGHHEGGHGGGHSADHGDDHGDDHEHNAGEAH